MILAFRVQAVPGRRIGFPVQDVVVLLAYAILGAVTTARAGATGIDSPFRLAGAHERLQRADANPGDCLPRSGNEFQASSAIAVVLGKIGARPEGVSAGELRSSSRDLHRARINNSVLAPKALHVHSSPERGYLSRLASACPSTMHSSVEGGHLSGDAVQLHTAFSLTGKQRSG